MAGFRRGGYLEVQVDQSLKNANKVQKGEEEADSNSYLTSLDDTIKKGKSSCSTYCQSTP